MDFMRLPVEVLEKLIESGREYEAMEHCSYCLAKFHNITMSHARRRIESVNNEQAVHAQA